MLTNKHMVSLIRQVFNPKPTKGGWLRLHSSPQHPRDINSLLILFYPSSATSSERGSKLYSSGIVIPAIIWKSLLSSVIVGSMCDLRRATN
jgi:hypothetical protein